MTQISCKTLFVFILTLVFQILCLAGEFTCQTYDLGVFKKSNSYHKHNGMDQLNIPGHGEKWPNGRVKYLFHSSLSPQDIQVVKKVFAEYHQKTCIRFEPKGSADKDYVSIEIGGAPCGVAIPCFQGNGYQYAMFNGTCRTMNTMLHELGHTLCLWHEHQRPDRDNFLRYQNCTMDKKNQANKYSSPTGLYNYQSMMHAGCYSCYGGTPTEPDVPYCGMNEPDRGLSVLDADQLNDMYNCQGCFRHRWRNANGMTQSDRLNLHSFGARNQDGAALYPCRTIYRGQVVVGHGTFLKQDLSCTITYSKQIHKIYKNVEVLIIPGGLSNNCFTYKLTDKKAARLAEAVPVAANNFNLKQKMYVAYSNTSNIKPYNTFGRVSMVNGFTNNAEFAHKSNVVFESQYSVLTCAIDPKCSQKHQSLPAVQKLLIVSDEYNENLEQDYDSPINNNPQNDVYQVSSEYLHDIKQQGDESYFEPEPILMNDNESQEIIESFDGEESVESLANKDYNSYGSLAILDEDNDEHNEVENYHPIPKNWYNEEYEQGNIQNEYLPKDYGSEINEPIDVDTEYNKNYELYEHLEQEPTANIDYDSSQLQNNVNPDLELDVMHSSNYVTINEGSTEGNLNPETVPDDPSLNQYTSNLHVLGYGNDYERYDEEEWD